MSTGEAERFDTLGEAVAEIHRLRALVARLEHELSATRQGVTATRASTADAPLTIVSMPRPAHGIGPPIAEVLTGSDEAAERHLADLRGAINRLREERTNASIELLKLTRLDRTPGTDLPRVPPAPPATRSSQSLDVLPLADGEAGSEDVSLAEPDTTETENLFPTEHPAVKDIDRPPSHLSVVPPAPPVVLQSEPPPQVFAAAPASSSRGWRGVIAVTVLVAAAAGAWIWLPSRADDVRLLSDGAEAIAPPADASRTSAPDSAPAGDDVAAPAVATSPSAAPVDSPARPAAPAPTRIELVTSRNVWLRVVVDGDRKISNVVSAGQTLPFDVAHELNVRAGDAGAVTVSVNGLSGGVLGANGAVISRTFQAQER